VAGHGSTVELARIKVEPGLEPGLTYQVSADVWHLPSLVWGDPFVFFFYQDLCRAEPRFDLYGVLEIASELWLDVARHTAASGDRVRNEEPIPADYLKVFGSDFTQIIGRPRVRKHIADALQLTSLWLHENAERHPTLTFYGA
jgi:hypothetical protein